MTWTLMEKNQRMAANHLAQVTSQVFGQPNRDLSSTGSSAQYYIEAKWENTVKKNIYILLSSTLGAQLNSSLACPISF